LDVGNPGSVGQPGRFDGRGGGFETADNADDTGDTDFTS